MGCRHKKKSFQFAFEILCFVWVLLRLIFFVHTWLGVDVSGVWPCFVTQTIYWFPMNIEFATFALLVVFYIKNERNGWTPKTIKTVRIAYASANTFYFILFCLWIIANVTTSDCTAPTAAVTARFVFSGAVFLSLAILLPLFCYRLVRKKSGGGRSSVSARQKQQTVILTTIITVVFISRVVFNFVSIDPAFQMNVESGSQIPVLAFVCFILWEIVPTMIVVVFFRKIPKTRRLCCCGRRVEEPPPSITTTIPTFTPRFYPSSNSNQDPNSTTPLINQGYSVSGSFHHQPFLQRSSYKQNPNTSSLRGGVFDNPDRYDTDDEHSNAAYNSITTPGNVHGYYMPQPGTSRTSSQSNFLAYSQGK